MSRIASHPSATSTIVDPGVQRHPESRVAASLQFASRAIGAALVEGRIGQVHDVERFNDPSLISACEFINDANRQVLRLEPDDQEGLEGAFRSYVAGSTFVTSALFGHRTDPVTLPVDFFGQWAHVKKYEGEPASVPWFVVAVAFAWIRCIGRMWTAEPPNLHLAEETRHTLRELGLKSGNQPLVHLLESVSNDELRLSIDHLMNGGDNRNALDRSIATTVDWVKGEISSKLPQNRDSELQALERSLVRALQHAASQGNGASPDEFVGLELIGPYRLMARMSATSDVRTEETHVRALAELHDRILQEMKRSVQASHAAKETNELVALHRKGVWKGNVSMQPAILDRMAAPSNERASSYHPSTLGGSLNDDRATDFGEFDEEGENSEEEEIEEEEEDEEGSQMEDEEGDLDDHQAIDRAVRERQRAHATERDFGLVPASGEVEPLEFDDSLSAYAPSSLGGLSKPWSRGAPSIASNGSFLAPVTRAIVSRSRDTGPSMIPAEQTQDLGDDKGSEYAPSILSGFSVPRTSRSAVGRFGRASSMTSHAMPHEPPFSLPRIEEREVENTEDPINSALQEITAARTAEWAATASASTSEGGAIIQEGSTVATLMDDNQTLGQRLSVHRAGEENLVLRLSQAHSELGNASAALAAKDKEIARLNEMVEVERDRYDLDVEQLQSDLEARSKVQEELETALRASRARTDDAMQYVDAIHRDSNQAIQQLQGDLEVTSRDNQNMQRERQDLSETHERMKAQLETVTLELQQISERGRTAIEERDLLQNQVAQMIEEASGRDRAIAEMNASLVQLAQSKQSLESETKATAEERDRLQLRLEEIEQTGNREMEKAKSKVEELSRHNKDLDDSLRDKINQVVVLERLVAADREGHHVQTEEKDRELLRTEESRRRLEAALEEARQEANEAQQVYEQMQHAIRQLRQALGMTNEEAPVTASSFLNQIEEVAATAQRQKHQRDEVIGKVRSLATRLSVEKEDDTLVTEVIDQAIATIDQQSRVAEDTHRGLVELANEADALNDPNIANAPSSELVRLAQTRFAEAKTRADDATRTLVEVARATGIEDVENVSGQSVIDRVVRANAENATMQSGLQTITGTVVSSPPEKLIRLAQEKFRALSELNEASAEEVMSLRRRSDMLQGSLDKAQLDCERERTNSLREIEDLKRKVQQLELQWLQKLEEASREQDGRQELERCRALLENTTRDFKKISDEKLRVEQTLAQNEVEWQRQLGEADAASAEVEQETKTLRQRIRELEQASVVRDQTEANARTESEAREAVVRLEATKCWGELEKMRQRLDRATEEHDRFREEVARERTQWQEQVDSFNRQLAEAAPGEAVALRLERDRLARELLDLTAQLSQLREVRSDRDRLSVVNEQLTVRLDECEKTCDFQDEVVRELRRQIATLEQAAVDANAVAPALGPHVPEPELQEDDFSGLSSLSPKWVPGPRELDQHTLDQGKMIADRQLELLVLDDKVEKYKSQLVDILEQIENAEATLADLKDNIELLYPEGHPHSLGDDVSIESDTPPTTPVYHFPPVTLDEWKERFHNVKPLCRGAKRYVLALGEMESKNGACDLGLLDNFLDPRKRFLYVEDLRSILGETLSFVASMGGASLERRRQRNKALRGWDNLQRIAMQAKRHALDDAFRLAIVCELILRDGQGISYEGAVLQRYCELILELSMTVTFRWRASAAQQRHRLIFTERDLPANDPTAIVVRFVDSTFQTFDRNQLIKTLIPNLVEARRGMTMDVPTAVDSRPWTPRESYWFEFDEEIPTSAPTLWVEEQLVRATILVPGLVHIVRDQTIDRMEEDCTYVQIARLGHVDGGEGCVLLVGQRDSWVVIDPLSTEDDDIPQVTGMRLVGVIRAPQGVDSATDRGFALMTWVREVFVHGMSVHDVPFRGETDRIRCTLEHHFGCLFHR